MRVCTPNYSVCRLRVFVYLCLIGLDVYLLTVKTIIAIVVCFITQVESMEIHLH
jgi:hypothetical protein